MDAKTDGNEARIELDDRIIPAQPFIGKTYPVVKSLIEEKIESLNGFYGNTALVIDVSLIPPDRFYPLSAQEIRIAIKDCELTGAFSEIMVRGIHPDVEDFARKHLADYESGKKYKVMDLVKLVKSGKGATEKAIINHMQEEFLSFRIHPLSEEFGVGKKRVLILDVSLLQKEHLNAHVIDDVEKGLLYNTWYFDEVRIRMPKNGVLDYEIQGRSLRDGLCRYLK